MNVYSVLHFLPSLSHIAFHMLSDSIAHLTNEQSEA